jgi:hypothetical protein
MTKLSTPQDVTAAIMQTSKEIKEILKKAMPELEKEFDEDKDAQAPADAPAADAPQSSEPPADAPADAPAEEPAPEGDAPAGDEAPEGEDDEAKEMAEHLASMEEGDLQALLQAIQEELAKRTSAQPAAPDAQAPAGPSPEMAGLQKSVAELAKAVSDMSKDVCSLKQGLKKSLTKVPSMNSSNNLEKSTQPAQPPQRLTKSETLDALISKKRAGNRQVTPDIMVDVNNCQNEADLHKLQDMLKLKGVL